MLVVIAGCTADVPVIEVSADEPLPAELSAGDIVYRGDISVVVPQPGHGVVVSVEMEDGSVVDFGVENPVDGAVRLATFEGVDEITNAPGISELTVKNPCTDGAYNHEGFHWATNYEWYFDAGSTPAGNNVANVEAGLQVAANAITGQRNNCGLADQVSATNTYAGRTTAAPSVTSAGSCGNEDGKNVVGFGPLPTGVLGLTCAFFDGDHHATEADVKMTTRRSWFAGAVPAGCTNRVGVEQVMTHEFGHVFGLAHVPESTHYELTMSPQAASCRNDKLTLGLGDVRGLRTLY